MYRRAGADRFGRAGSARSNGPPAAQSGRTGVDGRAGISGSGGSVSGAWERRSAACPSTAKDSIWSADRSVGRMPKLVYVTPAHQFPLGVTMSLRRRLALLEWARKIGRADLRGRLRQRVPLFRAAGPGAAGTRSLGRGDLRRKFQRGDVPGPAAGVPGRSSRDDGCVCSGAVDKQAPSAAAGAGRALRLHQRRPFRAPHPAHARGLCGAAGRFAGMRAQTD